MNENNENKKEPIPLHLQKLSQDKINQMRMAFYVHRNMVTVSKICEVHYNTVDKYKRREGWEDDVAQIDKQVGEKAKNLEVNRQTDNLKMVRAAKLYVMKEIQDLHESKSKSKVRLADPKLLTELIKCERLLIGEVNPTGESSTINIINAPNVATREERLNEIDRLQRLITEGNGTDPTDKPSFSN